MKTQKALIIPILVLTLQAGQIKAQEVLNREKAIELALQNNYDIKVAQKNLEIAENNSSLLNSGYLPTATVSGNIGVTFNEGENETVQGTQSFEATDAYNYSASGGLNYVIFNGFGRMYNYQSLKEQYQLSELQARQVIENTILQLSTSYYEIARLSENVRVLRQTLEISSTRLERANYSYEYGQSTQIEKLNAEVDVNNDSINLINASQQLENAKRNLNLLMGRDIHTEFEVDTQLVFSMPHNEEDLVSKAKDRNVLIAQQNSQLRTNSLAIKSGQSGWFPTLSANAGYNYSGSQNPNGAFLIGNSAFGPQAGLNLSWNVFDGGGTRTQVQNARLNLEAREIQLEQTSAQVERDLLNAYTTYTNALYVLNAEMENLATNRRNFDRSQELYKQGQISSIEFRQAQLNLRNAQNNASVARYNAKNAELQLKQLAGLLLEE